MVSNPHDTFVKAIFSQQPEARALLRAFLPAATLRRLDLDRLELIPGSLIDESLTTVYADLLFRVGARERDGYVYMLIEHKSAHPWWTLFQLLKSMVRLWADARAGAADTGRLPAIIPVVLYHGVEPWAAPRRFADLVDSTLLSRELMDCVPDFAAVVVDLAALDACEIRARLAGAALAQTAVLLLQSAWVDDLIERFRGVADLLRELHTEPADPTRLALVLRYALETDRGRSDLEAVAAFVARTVEPTMQNDILTTADRLRREGLERGLEEGRLRTQRRNLRRLLDARLGSVPSDLDARIEAAELSRLETWFERALTAASLDAVFEDG